jgi:hypothetical protein
LVFTPLTFPTNKSSPPLALFLIVFCGTNDSPYLLATIPLTSSGVSLEVILFIRDIISLLVEESSLGIEFNILFFTVLKLPVGIYIKDSPVSASPVTACKAFLFFIPSTELLTPYPAKYPAIATSPNVPAFFILLYVVEPLGKYSAAPLAHSEGTPAFKTVPAPFNSCFPNPNVAKSVAPLTIVATTGCYCAKLSPYP